MIFGEQTQSFTIGLKNVTELEYDEHHEQMERLGPVPECLEDFIDLRNCRESVLRALGMRPFDHGLWLFPGHWYQHIPEGFEIDTINGKAEIFQKGETDQDTRFGFLAFGILFENRENTH